MNKAELYKLVNNIRNALSLYNSYPLNSRAIASFYKQITLEELNFSNSKIGGILMKGEKHSFIGLNSCRGPSEQNFDCMHELFHFWAHPTNTYTCYSIPRNSYLEWEANEGAAEMLVPYYKFIPEIYDVYCYISNKRQPINYLEHFAQKYFVTPRVIQLRIKSLSYEINQYINGTPLNELVILSKNSQQKVKLNVVDFSVYLDFGYEIEWDSVIGSAYQ